MSSGICSLQGRTFHQLLQGLTWKNFDDTKDVTYEMLAEQLFQDNGNFESTLAQIKAVEAVTEWIYIVYKNTLLLKIIEQLSYMNVVGRYFFTQILQKAGIENWDAAKLEGSLSEYALTLEQNNIFMAYFLKEKEKIVQYLKRASTFNNQYQQLHYRIDLKSASKYNTGIYIYLYI